MKYKTRIIGLILIVLFMLTGATAQAHYVWFDPAGSVSSDPGEEVTVNVYLHAEQNDNLQGFGLNMGYDDGGNGTGELTFQSFDAVANANGLADYGISKIVNEMPQSKLAGSSSFSVLHAGLYNTTPDGYDVSADQDYLLFAVNFSTGIGEWDGDDVWVEWGSQGPVYTSFFEMASGNYDGGIWGMDMPVNHGPDFKATPIPGAALLLGGGLLAMLGFRRKKE